MQQIVRWQVDQFDFIGRIEDAVRHRLAHDDAGDLGDDVVHAFDVLDVDRRVDIDARVEQFDDVHPTLRMTRAGMIAVRQFVDQYDLRMAGERGIEIEFGQDQAAMLEVLRRQHLESLQQRFGFRAAVQLDITDDDIGPIGILLACRFEHRIALAHARRRAEEDLQPAAPVLHLIAAHACEQCVGIRSQISQFGGHAAIGDSVVPSCTNLPPACTRLLCRVVLERTAQSAATKRASGNEDRRALRILPHRVRQISTRVLISTSRLTGIAK